jgi:hypothetical protein
MGPTRWPRDQWRRPVEILNGRLIKACGPIHAPTYLTRFTNQESAELCEEGMRNFLVRSNNANSYFPTLLFE